MIKESSCGRKKSDAQLLDEKPLQASYMTVLRPPKPVRRLISSMTPAFTPTRPHGTPFATGAFRCRSMAVQLCHFHDLCQHSVAAKLWWARLISLVLLSLSCCPDFVSSVVNTRPLGLHQPISDPLFLIRALFFSSCSTNAKR